MGRKRHRDNDPDDRNFKRIWNQFLPELITGTVAALISAGGDRIFENGLPRLIVFFLIVAASIVGREICKSLRKRGRNGTAKKIRIRIIIGLAVFCLFNWNSVKLLAGDFVHLMDYTYYNMYKGEDETPEEDGTDTNSMQNGDEGDDGVGIVGADEPKNSEDGGESVRSEVEQKTPRDKTYRFVLLNPNGELNFANEAIGLEYEAILEKVYFFSAGTTDFDRKQAEEYRDGYVGRKNEHKEYEMIPDEHGQTFSSYSAMEDQFLSKVAETSSVQYQEDWLKSAPDSGMLETRIIGRIELALYLEEEGKGCSEIWWRLANDFQYYAQEYQYQTRNRQAISYLYTMSIYCCMGALEYELDDDTGAERYDYLLKRYDDIRYEESFVEENYHRYAEDVLQVLEQE